MAIGQESTAARYQRLRPIEFKTGDELNGYLARLDAEKAAAAKARDARKKAADDMFEFSKADLPDVKYKWATVGAKLHEGATGELLRIKMERDRATEAGDFKAMNQTRLDEARVRNKLKKFETAYNSIEDAQTRLAEGIADGSLSEARNSILLANLNGMLRGDWDYNYDKDELIFENARKGEPAIKRSLDQVGMNGYLFETPKEYKDYNKWITDTANNIGTEDITREYLDPKTGQMVTRRIKDIKDVNELRSAIDSMVQEDPEVLEEYLANVNPMNAPASEMKTREDFIDSVIDKAEWFSDTIDSRRIETPPKGDGKKTVADNTLPTMSSNAGVFDRDGNVVVTQNETRNVYALTSTVRGKISATPGLATITSLEKPVWEIPQYDENGEEMDEKRKVNARQLTPWNQVIPDFEASSIREEAVYQGSDPMFIVAKKKDAQLPEGYENWQQFFKEADDDELKDVTTGIFLRQGQYYPSGMINESKGDFFIRRAKDDGSDDLEITNSTVSPDDILSQSQWRTVMGGVDGNKWQYDIIAGSENAEFFNAINGESKGQLKEYLDNLGKDFGGGIVDPEKYGKSQGMTKEEVEAKIAEGKLPGPTQFKKISSDDKADEDKSVSSYPEATQSKIKAFAKKNNLAEDEAIKVLTDNGII
jgi:hypothetical protein